MLVSLNTLREWDEELVVEGNCVYLHNKVEYISSFGDTFTEDEWSKYKDEFLEDIQCNKFELGNEDNVGCIYSEHFPELVDTTLEEYESTDITPKSGVVVEVYRVIHSWFPIIVEFPTDTIQEDTEYQVEYSCEESVKEFEDVECYDDTLRVVCAA